MSIKRYTLAGVDGEVVRYEDHLAELALYKKAFKIAARDMAEVTATSGENLEAFYLSEARE